MKIKYFKDTILQSVINIIPFSLIKRMGHQKLIILYYHLVNDGDVPHISNLYKYKRTEEFCDDLDFLLKNYVALELSDVIQWVKGKNKLPPNSFLMTFDDGLREIYDVIAPILLRKGIPATFFISTDFLDNRNLCYQHKMSLLIDKISYGISREADEEIKDILLKNGFSFFQLSEGILKVDYRRKDILDKIAEILQFDDQDYLKEEQPYLTSAQIKSLIDQGFTIGAHSIDHPYYSILSLSEQTEQTLKSVKQIREKFNLNYGAFAFPHNDAGVSPEFFKKIRRNDLVDITFGTGGMLNGCLRSHKQRVSLENPLFTVRETLAWQYMRKIYKQIFMQRNKV